MVGANVVGEYEIGKARIRIADNYCKRTGSEIESLLRRIAGQAQRQFNAAAAAGYYVKEKDTEIPADYRHDDGSSARNDFEHTGGRPRDNLSGASLG